MNIKINSLLVSLLIIVNIPSCGFVKGYFPDKEKDYQLTTEIPDLVIPTDLSDHAIQNKPELTPVPTKTTLTPTPNQPTKKEKVIYIDLVEYSGGATRIRIEDTLERTWRTVGKALSRHSIEITDRNELDRVYFVQYDPDFKKVDDGSLWDEALFIFGADPAKEKEFRIKLAKNGNLSEIIVLDHNDKPLSSGNGLKLLNLLYKSIKEDLAD